MTEFFFWAFALGTVAFMGFSMVRFHAQRRLIDLQGLEVKYMEDDIRKLRKELTELKVWARTLAEAGAR
jgi:hypothetical protein